MTSLSEVYEGNTGEVTRLHRLYAGTAMVLLGALLGVFALFVVSTELLSPFVSQPFGARWVGGILGGIAVPIALVGVFVVLPASRRVRSAAAISAGLCLFGVALFWHAYPSHWAGYGDDLTLLVSGVYVLGVFVAFWSLFTAVVNFKTRNDPGGMLELNVVRRGETKVVEVDRRRGLGSVGFLGSTPDGEVETQTNRSDGADRRVAGSAAREASSTEHTQASTANPARTAGWPGSSNPSARSSDPSYRPTSQQARSTNSPSTRSTGQQARTARNEPSGVPASAASDGGATTADIRSPLDEPKGSDDGVIVADDGPSIPTDRYCGNCGHFQYVRSGGSIEPYCGLHDESMADMDACDDWSPNNV